MHFDLSPRFRAPWQRPQLQSPRSASPTSTTTLLPFRRSGRAVDISLSPVQEYAQPQWSVPQPREPTWAQPNSATAAISPARESFVPQQQQRQSWAGLASPHAYFDPTEPARPPTRSPYRDSESPTFYPPPPSVGAEPPVSGAPLPRQPFAESRLSKAGDCAAPADAHVRRDTVLSTERQHHFDRPSVMSPSPVSRPRGRGIAEVRPGCTTSTERVRYRNSVTKKLIDLYDEVAELYECRDNMRFQVTQAMRSDPRYSTQRHGEVRLAYKPTPPQQAAMAAVDTSLEALHDACHELVASYLTPEEKRYLGIDTHLFQTKAERTSTYQYAPPSGKGKGKKAQQKQQLPPPSPLTPGPIPTASTSRASSAASSARRQPRTRVGDDTPHAPPQQQQQQASLQDTNFTSQATSLPSAYTPPPLQPPPSLSPSPSPIHEERTASTVRVGQPASPSPLPEDSAVEGSAGSPERLLVPTASASSLGGGAWPSDTASATVNAVSAMAVPQPSMLTKTVVPASGGMVRGPQGQLLMKVPVSQPQSTTMRWPPGVPPGAKLVKMPAPVSRPASFAAVAAPAAVASLLPSSNPPSHPPSRTNSAINRTVSTAPKAPAKRAEFKRLLIDSDSDSTAV